MYNKQSLGSVSVCACAWKDSYRQRCSYILTSTGKNWANTKNGVNTEARRIIAIGPKTISSFKSKVRNRKTKLATYFIEGNKTNSLQIIHTKLTQKIQQLTDTKIYTGLTLYVHSKKRNSKTFSISQTITVASQLLLINPPIWVISHYTKTSPYSYSATPFSASSLTASTLTSSCLSSWLKFPFCLNSWVWWCLQ